MLTLSITVFSRPQVASALTLSPGFCGSGDACVADGNLSGGSTTSSCRIYGWDLTSSEWSVPNLGNYWYPNNTGCATLNVNNTANSSRNRMGVTQRNICYFAGTGHTGSIVFIDAYSPTITWRNMSLGSQNVASSFSVSNLNPCP